MTPTDLLTRIQSHGIELYLSEGELRFRAPKGALTSERRAYLQKYRTELTALLRKNEPHPPPDTAISEKEPTDPFLRSMQKLKTEIPDLLGEVEGIFQGAARRPLGEFHPSENSPDYVRALKQRHEAYLRERDDLTRLLDDPTASGQEREAHLKRYDEVTWFCEDHRLKLERSQLAPVSEEPDFRDPERELESGPKMIEPVELTWDPETADLVQWFTTLPDGALPAAPFKLQPWATVSNPRKFFEVLRQDIAAGPGFIRARRGILKNDLVGLKDMMEAR